MSTIQDYKCPSCGAPLVFDANSQNLHCGACGGDFQPESLEQISEAQKNVEAKSTFDWSSYEPRQFEEIETAELAGYSCPSCGAEVTGDNTLGATICPYCGNSTIIKANFEGVLKPDYVIPFKVDKNKAMECFLAACKKAPLLPKLFKSEKKIAEMTGVYVPFWMFDCDADGSVNFAAKRIRHWSDSNYNYTKTENYVVYREGSVCFENIPVDASMKADDIYMEAVEPYDYGEAVEFNTAYLSGYLADRYDVDVDESTYRANDRVKKSVEDLFKNTVTGYSAVSTISSSVKAANGKIRYSLLPVWMLNVKYKDQIYKYAINGQTGKVVGEFPICKKRAVLAFLKAYGLAFAFICAMIALSTFLN